MRKSLEILAVASIISIASAFSAFAGWEQQAGGQWKYSENNGYVSNGWYWLDGDSNGVAECYYLDSNGVMAVNTVVDSYTVDINGAWTVDGVVQTKVVNASGSNGNSGSSGRSESSQNQSNSGIPSLSDISHGTSSNMDNSDIQAGDSTGLPPMQSGSGGSSTQSSQTGNSFSDKFHGELGDHPVGFDSEWGQEFNEGIIR